MCSELITLLHSYVEHIVCVFGTNHFTTHISVDMVSLQRCFFSEQRDAISRYPVYSCLYCVRGSAREALTCGRQLAVSK